MKHLKNILRIIGKNKIKIFLTSLLDLGFVVASITAYFYIAGKILGIIEKLNAIINQSKLQIDVESQYETIYRLAQSTDFYSLYNGLFMWVVMLAVSVIVLWIAFQSITFWLNSGIFKKTKFLNYIGKFSFYSFMYYIMVVLSFVIVIYLSYVNNSLPFPLLPQGALNAILIVLLIVIFYFMFITLYLISGNRLAKSFKETLRLVRRKFRKTLVAYFWAFLKMLCCVVIFYLLFNFNVFLSFVFFILLLIPSISISRIIFFYFME